MNNLKVVMLGTGCPYPNAERAGASHLLLIDDLPILIDCGDEATTRLMKAGMPPQNVKHLWLTHLHSDHVMGYLQFLIGGWHLGRYELTVYGPVGTKKFHESILHMFEEDIAYRTGLGFPSNGILDVKVIEIEGPGEVETDLPAKVTAAEMVHSVLTYAYRFQVGEKSIVFTGDTSPNDELINLSMGADVLINDCCLTVVEDFKNEQKNTKLETIWEKLKLDHCTPTLAGNIATKAKVKRLVLTHFLPSINERKIYEEVSKAYSGPVIIPKDLQEFYV